MLLVHPATFPISSHTTFTDSCLRDLQVMIGFQLDTKALVRYKVRGNQSFGLPLRNRLKLINYFIHLSSALEFNDERAGLDRLNAMCNYEASRMTKILSRMI